MKTLILIILASVSLLSCKKKYCFSCNQAYKTVANGQRSIGMEYSTYCDMTEKEMDEYVDAHLGYSKDNKFYEYLYCNKLEY